MARPNPIQPAEPLLIVDGRTPFVAQSPVLTDREGAPYLDRRVELALVTNDRPSPVSSPIHPTLSGAAVSAGNGAFSLALMPRDLWLRLAPHAHKVIYLRTLTADHPPHFQPLRVVWRASTFPTPSAS